VHLITLLGTWLAVAAIAILIDLAYVRWNLCVAQGRLLQAMFWSAACPLLGFLSLWLCLEERTALIPSALGCALGTWLAMRWK
jgi:hypothetical protein